VVQSFEKPGYPQHPVVRSIVALSRATILRTYHNISETSKITVQFGWRYEAHGSRR
jgi:hypothetical protein